MIRGLTIYELLGGNKHDDKNNVLKSLFIMNIQENIVEIEAEPYDNSYDTNDMVRTIEKICRILDRREKAIFKNLNQSFKTEIDCLSIIFFDDMRIYGGATKFLNHTCKINYA